jgi:hypothetical protein
MYKNIGALKTLASTNYWRRQNIGAYKNLGVDKTLAHEKLDACRTEESTEHWRPPMLAQEKVGGDAEELPYF